MQATQLVVISGLIMLSVLVAIAVALKVTLTRTIRELQSENIELEAELADRDKRDANTYSPTSFVAIEDDSDERQSS